MQALRGLLTELRPLFGAIPKAKTAKLVRGLIEAISRVPDSTQLQVRQRLGLHTTMVWLRLQKSVLPAHVAMLPWGWHMSCMCCRLLGVGRAVL